MRKTKQTRSRHTRRHTKIVILPQDVRVNDALEGPLILRHAAHAIENASKVLERWSCQNSWPARELKNEHHLCPQLCTWSGAYTYSYLLSLQAMFALHTHYFQRWLVYLNTISLMIWCIGIALPIIPIIIDSLTTTWPYHVFMYIYTHIWIYIYVLYQFICSSCRTWVCSYTRVHDYTVAHIRTYICIHIYTYIYIYIYTYIYLYFITASSMPKIAMFSGVLPAISCTKSRACLVTQHPLIM